MDIDAVTVALAAAGGSITPPAGTPTLTTYAEMPLNIDPPAFVVGEIDIDFDQTFNRGLDELTVVCRLLVGFLDDQAAAKLLNKYLSGSGTYAFKAACEADKTLAGACRTLRVTRVAGRRLFEWAGTEYLGAEIYVTIWGNG